MYWRGAMPTGTPVDLLSPLWPQTLQIPWAGHEATSPERVWWLRRGQLERPPAPPPPKRAGRAVAAEGGSVAPYTAGCHLAVTLFGAHTTIWKHASPKPLSEHSYSLIHNHQKLQATEVSFSRCINTQAGQGPSRWWSAHEYVLPGERRGMRRRTGLCDANCALL